MIGPKGDPNVEKEALLVENQVNDADFSPLIKMRLENKFSRNWNVDKQVRE